MWREPESLGFMTFFEQQWPLRRTHQLQSLGSDAKDVFSLKLGNYPRNGFDCESQEIRDAPDSREHPCARLLLANRR